MKPIGQIRRENLAKLVKLMGSAEKLASVANTSPVYLSQIALQVVDRKTGKPREMGSVIARRLETAARAEGFTDINLGWMDVEHAEASERDLLDEAAAHSLGNRFAETDTEFGLLEVYRSMPNELRDAWVQEGRERALRALEAAQERLRKLGATKVVPDKVVAVALPKVPVAAGEQSVVPPIKMGNGAPHNEAKPDDSYRDDDGPTAHNVAKLPERSSSPWKLRRAGKDQPQIDPGKAARKKTPHQKFTPEGAPAPAKRKRSRP